MRPSMRITFYNRSSRFWRGNVPTLLNRTHPITDGLQCFHKGLTKNKNCDKVCLQENEGCVMDLLTKKDLADTLIEFYGKVIEPQFNKINEKLEEHDRKFADLLNHFDQIYHRLDRLETEYHTITFSIQRIEEHLDGVEKRLGHVEIRLDGVDKRLDKVEGRLDGVEKHLERIEGKLDKEIDLKEHLQKEVADLKQRASLLQNRIEELENRIKILS